MIQWLFAILVAIDQLANAVLGGEPDETLSARAHRARVSGHKYWGWTADLIDAILFFDVDHCRRSHESEVLRRQLPKEYQNDAIGS